MGLIRTVHNSNLLQAGALAAIIIIAACTDQTGSVQAPQDQRNGQAQVPVLEDSRLTTHESRLAGGALVQVVLITTSKACKCTMARCQSGEQALKKAMAKHPKAPKIEQIDYAKQPDQAMQLVKKYKGMMLPIIYFLDDGDNLLWKIEGDIDWAEVERALEKYSAVVP